MKDADKLVGDGERAFRERLGGRGHPLVVNQWASWCESCRFEFRFFREMAREHRKTVAFLRLDSQGNEPDAGEFLRELPVGFPSVFDPDASVARSLGGGTAWPTTFFFDRRGRQVHTKLGAYATVEQLEQDIERYALRG